MRVGRQKGFTLLEVVIALGILALALTAAIKGISSNINNATHLKEMTLAHWVGMNKVAEMQVSGEWPSATQLKGNAEMAGIDWFWTVNVSTTEDDEVRRLDVSVAPESNHDQVMSTLVAYLGKPE